MPKRFDELSPMAQQVLQAIPMTGSFGTTNEKLTRELIESGWVEPIRGRLRLSHDGALAYANTVIDTKPGRSRASTG